jgi:HTH-type transcriptional regulator / antitoxin HigA
MIDTFGTETEEEVMSGKYTQPDFNAVYEEYLALKNSIAELPPKIRKYNFSNEDESTFLNISNLRTKTRSETGCLFRRAVNSPDTLINLWLSAVVLKAGVIVAGNNFPEFLGLTKDDLNEISILSVDERNILNIPKLLLKKGIIVTYEKSLDGMKLDGIVYKNEYGNPVIGISFRFPRLDSFWFTLMHELAHICLHYEKLDTVIYDDITEDNSSDLVEMQADKLARDSLISRSAWRSSASRRDHSKINILKDAKKMNVHPAIVAGRLRFETNNYSLCSGIINEIDVRELVFRHE